MGKDQGEGGNKALKISREKYSWQREDQVQIPSRRHIPGMFAKEARKILMGSGGARKNIQQRGKEEVYFVFVFCF